MKRLFATVSLALMLVSAANCAQATFVSYGSSWGFGRITANHPEDVGPLLKVELGSDSDYAGYAAFRFDFAAASFSNNPEISAIYLEDGAYSLGKLFAAAPGTLTSPNPYFDPLQSSAGTQFGVGTPSQGLPGAGSLNPAFINSSGHLASSTGAGNGLNAGEHAVFFVKLNAGVTLQDIVDALNNPVLDGGAGYDLRIGLREVNDAGGAADGYLLNAPEPATMGVWAVGLAVMGGIGAWRRKKSTA
jgi:MYXO-CTERM domain-containing protein